MDTSLHSAPAAHGDAPAHRFFRRRYVWQWPVRVFHWTNAIAVAVLFATGLYIAAPKLAPAGEAWHNLLMAKVRLVHFCFAYVMLVNFLFRIYWFWMGNAYARSGFPYVWRRAWWNDLFRQTWDYLRLERGHIHLGHNSLAGVAYTVFVIALGWAQILTGLALYSEADPSGFWGHVAGWVIPLLGGSFQTHMWHHTFAWGFACFTVLHVYIVFYDGQQFKNGLVGSMISGEKFFREGDIKDEPGAR